MKLSIVMDQYNNPYAGTESQVLKLVRGLLERGWEVRFAVLRGTDYSRNGDFPVPIDELGVGSLAGAQSWLRVLRYARQLKVEGYCLVHVFFNDASIICPPIMRLVGLRTLISRRDMGFWYTRAYLMALRVTGRFVSGAVCNSRAVAEYTKQMERLPAGKLHVIYNGYTHIESDGRTGPVAENPPHRPVVGIVANLRPIKRIDDLIRATAILVNQGRDIELRIVGGGDPVPYQKLVDNLELTRNVCLTGSVQAPEQEINNFDVAVLCSESEGFSNAVIEYMRAGKPVVCTRTGGNPEIVADGVNGFLVEVGDTGSLANRIAQVLDDRELGRRMGEAGMDRLANKYSLDTMLRRHIDLYQSITQGADTE
ncbi:MAG: glycosyltransferase family 4 protein [Marinobacter sp.]|uniref:glycosyltransferase family 4 protein n=1 Tax=Marinobacter sp. TaxID=50741 RepID=UPI00299E8201|nr:glycosyltransferase family 4 protein [Marinobacter sp.]MDX1754882.1 glycosyltransferase family 4 protein [Marinobacter sp.]